MSIRVGQPAPHFEVQGYDRQKDDTEQQFRKIALSDFTGQWICLFFYPRDFTFVCPTEIAAFNSSVGDFAERNCVILTASTDSVYAHKGWCDSHRDLKNLKYLMLSDVNHRLSAAFNVLDEEQGLAQRGIFLIDPKGSVRWLAVNDLGVGRNVAEVLRVLEALQTDALVPCNWKPGDPTLG